MTRFAYQTVRGGQFLTAVTGLPAWARLLLFLLALPGIVLVTLSLVLTAASVAALLIPTVPAYRLLRQINLGTPATPAARPPTREARQVQATVIRSESFRNPPPN